MTPIKLKITFEIDIEENVAAAVDVDGDDGGLDLN